MPKSKSFNIRNRDLGREISRAEKSEGYLVMITRRSNNQLLHTYFTFRFLDNDIPIALEFHKRLLEKNILKNRPTDIKKIPGVPGKKELPPEYRK